MAAAIRKEIDGVLERTISRAWGQYSFMRALVGAKFGCLGIADRGELLSIGDDGRGAQVLKKVMGAGMKIVAVFGTEGRAMDDKERAVLDAADDKVDRQMHEWGYGLELWLLGVGVDAVGPVWEARGACGGGEREEDNAQLLAAYGKASAELTRYIDGLCGEEAERLEGMSGRLKVLQDAVKVEEAGAAGVNEIFSAIGNCVRETGSIDDHLLRKAVGWLEQHGEGKQEEDFVGMLGDRAGGVPDDVKQSVAEFMALSVAWAI